MSTQPKLRAAIYTRDMSNDGPEQINLDREERPEQLKELIHEAGQNPRPFDAVAVPSMPVLGTPSQAKAVVEELKELGVQVMAADGSTA